MMKHLASTNDSERKITVAVINAFPKYVPSGNMELVTPAMASNYLKHNEHNPRKSTNRNQIEAYARDMAAGKWFANGEPIVFDANGDLKDGQHRLMAIVKANVPVYMFVIRGVDPEYTTFDYGMLRRMSQELGVSRNVEVIANLIVSNAYAIKKPSKGIVRDYMIHHQEMINRAISLSQIGGTKSIGLKRDVYVAIYLMMRCGEDASEIEQFMRVVNSQFMLTERESSSAIVLFKYLNEQKITRAERGAALVGMETVVAAYTDFSKGEKRTRAYKITSTARVQNMLTKVRREDGLEG